MTFFMIVIYVFVGLGVFLGSRESGNGPVRSVWNAVMWPFVFMIEFGRAVF